MHASAPAWLPDPSGRHQLRWWDGNGWTPHVADGAATGVDPLRPPASGASFADAAILRLRREPGPRSTPGLLRVFDPAGEPLAALTQVPVPASPSVGAFGASAGGPRYELRLTDGTVIGALERPASGPSERWTPDEWGRAPLRFADPDGSPMASIAPVHPPGGGFELALRPASDGHAVDAVLRRSDPGGRRWLFSAGDEVLATVDRSFGGPPSPGAFAPVDYAIRFVPPMTNPVRVLAVAAVTALDLTCSQVPDEAC